MEWCHDRDADYPTPSLDFRYDDNQHAVVVTNDDSRVTRGGAFLYQPLDARSAQRYSHSVTSRRPYLGFRIARTIRPADRETSK
jgi:formylglycine-generating enzyme required for sulfatase activity